MVNIGGEPDLVEFRYKEESKRALSFGHELGNKLEKAESVKDLLGLYYDANVSRMRLDVKADFQEAVALKLSEKNNGEPVSAIFFQIANDTRNTKLILDSSNK